MKEEKPKKAVLIYDGNCPVCSGTVAWIKDREQTGAFEMLSCQSTEMSERFPSIEEAVCMQAMQLVLPDGTVLPGEKALPEIFKKAQTLSPGCRYLQAPRRKDDLARPLPLVCRPAVPHRKAAVPG